LEIYLAASPGSQLLRPWRLLFLPDHRAHAPHITVSANAVEQMSDCKTSVAQEYGWKFIVPFPVNFLTSS
jgi:hypothetical protein